jgi:hypothetical protein
VQFATAWQQRLTAQQPRFAAPQQRADHEHHDEHVGRRRAQVDERGRRFPLEAREHQRQERPGRRVVDGARTDRDRAHARAGQPLVVDDAREHREGRDRHRRAQEQHRLGQRRAFGEQRGVRVQHRGEPAAERERRRFVLITSARNSRPTTNM